MKKILGISLCIFAVFISCSCNLHTVITKEDKEISEDIRNVTDELAEQLLEGIKNKDEGVANNLLSEELLNSEQFEMKSFLDSFSQALNSYDFQIEKEYYTTVQSVGNTKNFTVFSSLSDNYLMINNLYIPHGEAFSMFYKSTNPGEQLLLFINWDKYEGKWFASNIHIGKYGFSGMTAPALYEKVKEQLDNGNLGSAIFFTLGLKQVLRPTSFLQYRKENEYSDIADKVIHDANEKIQFPVEIGDIKVFSLDIITSKKEGIIPMIKYVTQKELSEEILNIELEHTMNAIYELLPGLESNFDLIQMAAFNELPVDESQQYKYYKLIIETNNKEQTLDA